MDECGEWKNELWADFCAGRRIKLQFQRVGAHPWLLERRDGPARGIYNRLIGDDRLLNKTILAEVQWCLNAMLSASGFSASQMAFCSNPLDLFGWEDGEKDVIFAQDAYLAGQCVKKWKLRVKAQEAKLKEFANGKLP